QWSGNDGRGGSGIAFYEGYVSANGGAFTPLTTPSQTSTTFTGQDGHRYGFYTRAHDNTRKRQPPTHPTPAPPPTHTTPPTTPHTAEPRPPPPSTPPRRQAQ